MEATVPFTTAAELVAASSRRGEEAGKFKEYNHILELLKEHGHYDALLTLQVKYEKHPVRLTRDPH